MSKCQLYVMMITGKEKALKIAEQIRKAQRQEIIAANRPWMEMPSAVFELPHRIQYKQWQNFESLLDSITEKDIYLVDNVFKQFLHEQWTKITPNWQDQAAVNVIRALFRVKIANSQNAQQLLEMAMAAGREMEKEERAGEVLMKLLKEVAINLEGSASSINQDDDLWISHLKQMLNEFTSSLTFYRQAASSPSLEMLLKENLVFYVVLLSDRRVQLEQFVKINNVGQLYLLINGCLDHSDNFLVQKTLKIITKLLAISGSEEAQNCLNGIQVLITHGIQAALRSIHKQPLPEQPKPLFFTKFLKMASKTDTIKLLSAADLLANLFNKFDQCIPAACQARYVSQYFYDPNSLYQREYSSMNNLVESLLEMMVDLQLKGYWIISNVTGSVEYFRQYGLHFLQHIYVKDYAELSESEAVRNEIAICVLNYLCLISKPQEIEELAQIVKKENQNKEQTTSEASSAPNCFLFCLSIAVATLGRICFTASYNKHILSEQGCSSLIHRAIFAIHNLLQHSQTLKQPAICLLQRGKVQSYLQLLQGMPNYEQQGKLIEQILDVLSEGESVV